MKTTEIFVEQVLIGAMVLLTIAIPFFDHIFLWLSSTSDVLAQIAMGGAFLGAAYLIGIIYDRCSDTMLQDIERHMRLRFADSVCKHRDVQGDDPFPEDEYRVRILRVSAAVEYANYLRTRIRLTRAICTLIPAIAAALVLFFVRESELSEVIWYAVFASTIVVYLLAIGSKIPGKGDHAGLIRGYRPPKTKDLAKYTKRGGVLWFVAQERLSAALLVVTSLGAASAIMAERVELVAIPVAGVILTILIGWVWWRISRTFFQFLDDFNRFYDVAR